MRPLGFSLLASIVDASRLSERLFLSSLPGSLHVSLFSAVCVTPYPFPPFSLYHWPSHFMGFFFCHSDWCISKWIFWVCQSVPFPLQVSAGVSFVSVSLSQTLYLDSSLAQLHLTVPLPSLYSSTF